MEARVVIAEANAGQLDDLANFWDHEALQDIRGLDGNRGFLLLADPDTNRVIAISLWDTKEEAQAAGGKFQEHAAQFQQFMSNEPSREDFDVRIGSFHETAIHPQPK
ncbi:MAG TPA: hypothetical protein VHT97_14070 [Acidimicrobiales bacterium]|jgi:heme-degrading monooxygenase HmoA|nr:hypothetical protein [Acidimicrobiales bacterium]